ncbi:MAG: hypothetical protein RMY36_003150 [Nostoc sp. SerVER01]|nr:hypothetical protein [Nostoc sp. SerVER01]
MSSHQGGRGWLSGIAAIIGAIAVSIGTLHQIGIFPTSKNNQSPTPSTPPLTVSQGSTSFDPKPIIPPPPEQAEIETVINTSYLTYRIAFRDLNKAELQASFTGEALKAKERLIEANSKLPSGDKLAFINIEYDYSNTQFEDYQVINNERVKIKATKRIKSITFWADANRCIGYQPEHSSIQIFDLVKTSTGWLVSNVKALHKTRLYGGQCPT